MSVGKDYLRFKLRKKKTLRVVQEFNEVLVVKVKIMPLQSTWVANNRTRNPRCVNVSILMYEV